MNKTTRVKLLNDTFRRGTCTVRMMGGELIVTRGVLAYGNDFLDRAILAVRSFDAFDEDNDPHGEHDYGSFILDDQKLMWKIDYYDQERHYGSEDASDPTVTRRVLTILLMSEY